MKSSFKDIDETEQTPPTAAIVVPPTKSGEIVPDSFFSNSEMEGDFDRSDIQLPKLNLVQNVGPLLDAGFQAGHFVFAKELDIGGGPFEATLMRMRKYFLEDLPYGADEIPRLLNSVEEVRKSGAFLSQEKREFGEGHTYFKSVLDAQVLIKGAPDNTVFPFEYKGSSYAIAVWTIQSVAYSRVGKQFITASQFGLKTGLTGGFWNISSKREKIGVNTIWVPVARQAGRNDAEFQDWVKSLGAS